MEIINHGFKPVYNSESKILILGSFPSVKSREVGFYYGHPQNRFWDLLALLLDTKPPKDVDEKIKLLLDNHIALYDAVETAQIKGSMDADLRVIAPSDISDIINKSNVSKLFCNGLKSYNVMKKIGVDAIKLPSTSAANARYRMEDLYREWLIIKKYL